MSLRPHMSVHTTRCFVVIHQKLHQKLFYLFFPPSTPKKTKSSAAAAAYELFAVKKIVCGQKDLPPLHKKNHNYAVVVTSSKFPMQTPKNFSFLPHLKKNQRIKTLSFFPPLQKSKKTAALRQSPANLYYLLSLLLPPDQKKIPQRRCGSHIIKNFFFLFSKSWDQRLS